MPRPSVLWLLALWLSGLTGWAQSLTWIGDDWRCFKGRSEPSPDGMLLWTLPGFDDAAWLRGPMGFSAGTHSEATPLSDLPGQYSSLYLRRQFVVTNRADIAWLGLRLRARSGVVAYLNGAEVFRANLPGERGGFVPFHAAATNAAETGLLLLDVSASLEALRDGDNVLALQVHTAGAEDGNLLALAELVANFSRAPAVADVGTASATVSWETVVPAGGRLCFGTNASALECLEVAPSGRRFLARLEGLRPDTLYHYRIVANAGQSEGRSPLFSFRTAAESGPVKFAVVGDTGLGTPGQYAVAKGLAASGADLVLHTGDIAYPSLTFDRVDLRCLSVYQPQMAGTPFYFTLGNHDLYSGSDGPFVASFVQPTNSVTGTSHYFSFDRGDVHFVSVFLPTLTPFAQAPAYRLAPDSPHFQWLTNDLARTTKPWKVVFFHSPLNTSSLHRFDDYDADGAQDRAQIRALLLPVLAQHGVQAVFNGHDHNYERFRPVNGVHQFVTGGGGAVLYGMAERDPENAWFHSVHHHLRVSVEGDLMHVSAVAADGTILDSTTVPRTPLPQDHDSDLDGATDVEELLAGTDPDNAASFQDLRIERGNGGALVRWRTTPGRHYELLSSTNLLDGFAPHPGAPLRTAQGTNDSYFDPTALEAVKFYRLRIGP